MMKKVQKFTKRILCLLLALCVGSSAFQTLAVSQETQEQIDKVKQEKEAAEEQKKEAEQEKNQINNKKTETEYYLKNLNAQSKSLSEQISILDGDISQKEVEITEKKAQVAQAQQELEQQYADMKKRIQYMYENGQNTMITYLTAALTGGISDMLNQVEYASNISSYDRDMLENFKSARNSLEQQQAELEDEQEALALLKEETEKKKQQVASQQEAAGSKLSEFDKLLAQMTGDLTNMDALIQEKTALLNQLIKKAEEEERQARIQAAQNAASSMDGVTIIAGNAQISGHHITLSDYEMLLLATMIYCEAGNQGMEGQLAVGYVIMNRVRSALYPNSLEAVLRQSKQFEPAGSGRFDLVLRAEQDDDIPDIVTQSCWDAAATVVNGTSNVGESLFFRTWAPVPQLITNLQNGGVPYWIIKDHIFYYYWTSYSKEPEKEEEPEDDQDEEEEEEQEPDQPEEDMPVSQEQEKPSEDSSPEESQDQQQDATPSGEEQTQSTENENGT